MQNSAPTALPQCIKAIANARITNQRLRFNLIKFALGLLHDLAVTDSFPTAPTPTETKSTQTGSDPPQSWLHAPLTVLRFEDDNSPNDTTSRTNTQGFRCF